MRLFFLTLNEMICQITTKPFGGGSLAQTNGFMMIVLCSIKIYVSVTHAVSLSSNAGGLLAKLGDENIIIIAIIAAAIVVILVVCIVLLVICRRQRTEDKCKSFSQPAYFAFLRVVQISIVVRMYSTKDNVLNRWYIIYNVIPYRMT